MRKKAAGGLANKRSGLGPGSRHGMAAGAVWHLPASTRELRLANGDVITIDVLCRKCGFENKPHWNKLRCENCRRPLDQLGTLLTNHTFRAVGWHTSYKNKQRAMKKAQRKAQRDKSNPVNTQHGTSHGSEPQQIFGFSGKSIRSIVQRAAEGGSYDEDDQSSSTRSPPRPKPSLSNLRHETNDVIGQWVCAIETATGDDYFYNRKTRVVTWDCPRELEGLL